jgi:hypothetical protein
MMYSENQELSIEERAQIAALPRELAPSDLLEERVVRALRTDGHFGTATLPSRHWSGQLMRVAAAIALFAGGVATGHYALSQPETGKQTAPVNQASVSKPAPQTSGGAQTVKNTETIVAEREMWL